jgi:hypothetical protein
LNHRRANTNKGEDVKKEKEKSSGTNYNKDLFIFNLNIIHGAMPQLLKINRFLEILNNSKSKLWPNK